MNRTKTVRKNLVLDDKKIQALRKVLGVSSESEAVREAINRALAGEETLAAFQRLKKGGTWMSASRKTSR